MSDNNELQKQLKKNVQTLKYEQKLSDISTTDHVGFITDNLLMHENTLDYLYTTYEQELDEVSYFTQIKAKQRIYDDNDQDIHDAEYIKGQKAIELMTDKESHRNMTKRENKMAESSKKLNEANLSAIAIKKKYANPSEDKKNHFKDLKARVKDSVDMYEKIHSADRYFAEAVANNKIDEGKLKAKADINFYNKLFQFFLRELNTTTDPKEQEFLSVRQKAVMNNLIKARSSAESKYGLHFSTEIILNDNEQIDDSKEFYQQEKEDIKTVNEEIENNINKLKNNEEINKDSAVSDWNGLEDTKTLYTLELRRGELDEEENTSKNINEQKDLLKENISLSAITDKYAKKMEEENAKLSKKYPSENRTVLKSTSTYTRFAKQFEKQYRTQIKNQFRILTLNNALRSIEDNKNNQIKPEDMGTYRLLREYDLAKNKQNTAIKFKNDINSNSFVLDYGIPINILIAEIDQMERKERNNIIKLENAIVEQYKTLNKVNVKESVDFTKAYSSFKSNLKVNDVPIEKYDSERAIDYELKYHKAMGATEISEKSLEFIQSNQKYSGIYKTRYFLQGSQAEKKYTKEFEGLLKPIMLDEKGEVLEKYRENDEYNKKIVNDTFESELDVSKKREMLDDFIERGLSFKYNSNIFTLNYITESEENFVEYLKVKDFFRAFNTAVLNDPLYMLIIRTHKKDFDKKLEKLQHITELVNAQANLLSLDLQKTYSINDSFAVTSFLSQDDYQQKIKEWNKIFNNENKSIKEILKQEEEDKKKKLKKEREDKIKKHKMNKKDK